MPHLGGGGAERVMALVTRGLSAEKYELHLGLIAQTETGAEGLPPWVHLHVLGASRLGASRVRASRVRGGAFRLLRLVHRLKPDLILSGIFHLNFLVLLMRPLFPRGTRILARQNGTASAALAFGGLPWYSRLLYRLLYRRADRIICQTQAMAQDLAQQFGVPADRLTVLPNPVDVEEIRHSMIRDTVSHPEQAPHLLAVGRLVREKGFDLLLPALARVRKQFPEASLLIAGSGPEEAALKAECHALGLDDAVCFAGYLREPWAEFPAATLFVLPSRQEGLPNALLEAAAGGLPLVALPASGGVVELLRGQPGVWLAPEVSVDALAASLLDALRALGPGERFAHPFIETFRMDCALQAYERLIDRTLAENRKT
jgi:glycosyltransferase involved in cell wall biosynthesis